VCSRWLDERFYSRGDPFNEVLVQIDELRANPQKYYHVAAIINSAGRGKTTAAVDICRVRRAVYIGLSVKVPIRSVVYNTMFTLLKLAAEKPIRALIASQILFTLQSAATSYTSPTELYNAQFVNSEYHVKVADIWNNMNHLKGARQLVEPVPVSVPNEATETAAFKRDSSSERGFILTHR
jgi:hypothetical protein